MLSVSRISSITPNSKINRSNPSFGIGRRTSAHEDSSLIMDTARPYFGQTVAQKADTINAKAFMVGVQSQILDKPEMYRDLLFEIGNAEELLFDLRLSDTGMIYDNENQINIILNEPVIRYFDEKNGTHKIITLFPDGSGVQKIDETDSEGYHTIIERKPNGIKYSQGVKYLADGMKTTEETRFFDKNGALRILCRNIVNKKTEKGALEKTERKIAYSPKTGNIAGALNNIVSLNGENSYTKADYQFIYNESGKLDKAYENLSITDKVSKADCVYKFKHDGSNAILAKYAKNFKFIN